MATIKELLLDIQARSSQRPLSPKELAEAAEAVLECLVNINTSLGMHPHPSYGQPINATQEIADALEALGGVKVSMDEAHESPPGTGIMHRNLVAIVGAPAPAEPVVAWSAHVDTVPAKTDWQHGSPFKLHKEPIKGDDHKLIGRGVFDMKASLAAMLVAVAANADRLREAGKSMALLISSGEELGFIGIPSIARMVNDNGITLKEIVIGEPSDTFILYGLKGAVTRNTLLKAPSRDKDAAPCHEHNFTVTIANPTPQYAAFVSGQMFHPLDTAMRIYKGYAKAKNFLKRKFIKHMVGAEPGQLACRIAHDDEPSARVCHRLQEVNCAEAALEYSYRYLKHSNSAAAHFRSFPKDTGYAYPFMNTADPILNFVHANTEQADIQPILLKTPQVPMHSVDAIWARIQGEVVEKFPGLQLTFRDAPRTEPIVQNPDATIFAEYMQLARVAGVPIKDRNGKPVKLPYACDGNALIEHFPGIPIVIYGAGGVGNGAHSPGEFKKASELAADSWFWDAALRSRVLEQPVRAMALHDVQRNLG